MHVDGTLNYVHFPGLLFYFFGISKMLIVLNVMNSDGGVLTQNAITIDNIKMFS